MERKKGEAAGCFPFFLSGLLALILLYSFVSSWFKMCYSSVAAEPGGGVAGGTLREPLPTP